MLLQACLNGARPPGFHPALPLTAEALAADAAAVLAAGAGALHVHPRRPGDLAESLAPEVVGPLLARLAGRAPGLPVGVSTGEWIEQDDGRQLAAIRGWARAGRPAYASVNLAERNALPVMRALLEAGVGIEAGLAVPEDARRLLASGLAPACLRVLVEIDDLPGEAALARTRDILHVLAEAGHGGPHLVHGFGGSVWPVFDLAVELGHDTRLGLEDGDLLPDGRRTPDNAGLVAAGLARAAAIRRSSSPGSAPRP